MPQKTVYRGLANNEWARIGRYVEDHPEESLNRIAQRFKIKPSTLRSKSRPQGWRTQQNDNWAAPRIALERCRARPDAYRVTDRVLGSVTTHFR